MNRDLRRVLIIAGVLLVIGAVALLIVYLGHGVGA